MREYLKFYINGQWVDPVEKRSLDVDNPTTEQVSGQIAIGSAADVDKAVEAARKAFATWSQTTREERLEVLGNILAEYQKRAGDLADAVTGQIFIAAGGFVGRFDRQTPSIVAYRGHHDEPPWTVEEIAAQVG